MLPKPSPKPLRASYSRSNALLCSVALWKAMVKHNSQLADIQAQIMHDGNKRSSGHTKRGASRRLMLVRHASKGRQHEENVSLLDFTSIIAQHIGCSAPLILPGLTRHSCPFRCKQPSRYEVRLASGLSYACAGLRCPSAVRPWGSSWLVWTPCWNHMSEPRHRGGTKLGRHGVRPQKLYIHVRSSATKVVWRGK